MVRSPPEADRVAEGIDVGPGGTIEGAAQATETRVELVIILTILAVQRGRAKRAPVTSARRA